MRFQEAKHSSCLCVSSLGGRGVAGWRFRALGYQSDAPGENNVYVRALSGSSAPVRVSPNGGWSPAWRADGRELFYMRPDGTVMAVAVDGESFGEARELFGVPGVSYGRTRHFAVSPDGQRVLVLEDDSPPLPLRVIQNWTALLER